MAKIMSKYMGGVEPSKNSKILKNKYLPSPALVEAVNATLFLGNRPLLLKGEPGCGKTQVAAAVADELGLPYFRWDIKSTSRAKDGLYIFDAVRRLQESQLSVSDDTLRKRDADPMEYISFGPLGEAFICSTKNPKARPLILIDEIDKADIDFPNDLLLELDEQKFKITEAIDKTHTKDVIEANNDNRPIIFITSNDERDLPAAFLRRCLYFFVDFPDPTTLINILNSRPDSELPLKDSALIEQAVARFQRYRDEDARAQGTKKPSTSELIDWVRLLHIHPDKAKTALGNSEVPNEMALDKSGKVVAARARAKT